MSERVYESLINDICRLRCSRVPNLWEIVKYCCSPYRKDVTSRLAFWLREGAYEEDYPTDGNPGFPQEEVRVQLLQFLAYCYQCAGNEESVKDLLTELRAIGSVVNSLALVNRASVRNDVAVDTVLIKSATALAKSTLKFWRDDDYWGPKWRGYMYMAISSLGNPSYAIIQVQRSVEFLMRSVAEVSEVPRINPDVVVDKSIDFSRRHHFLHDSRLRTNGKLGELRIESKKFSICCLAE